jgi:hypothetical protein
MHRVRVGIFGLAWVFLLVMLATALVHVAGDQQGGNSAAASNMAAPSEPLAELGVAPGNPDQDQPAPPAHHKTRAPAH